MALGSIIAWYCSKYNKKTSGGPKWFTLFGLDRYLFGEFFNNRTKPLHLIGSSAGAFRFAALAQNDPVAAIKRLANHYSRITYSKKPTLDEISTKGEAMVDVVLGQHGATEIIANAKIHPHFITAQTKGFLAFEQKLLQFAGLTKSYLLNRINRRYLAKQYERVMFTPVVGQLQLSDPAQISTHEVLLTHTNLADALLASGAIPLLLRGIRDIEGAPNGTYRDGGIIDYHFDLNLSVKDQTNGLVLFPHFNSKPRAGWFDKKLKRTPLSSSYDNVVMLSPTKEFITELPFGKIPDREDFTALPADVRFEYWDKVLSLSSLLADDLSSLIEHQTLDLIKPLELN